jgi:EpsI family protein
MARRYTSIILACVAMLGAGVLAEVFTPHQLMARTQEAFNIEKRIPYAFGQWTQLKGVDAIRPPPTELEQRLYSQEVSRVYVDPAGHVVMLMIAYGESQSDMLQMHHPEVCYTAQGFRVSQTKTSAFQWSPTEPAMRLTRLIASREGRQEPISYWMRIGYDNTTSNWARQALKLGYGLKGLIPDGVLVRVSTIGVAPDLSFKLQDQFMRDFLSSVTPETRAFLVGDPSKAMLSSPSI